MNIHKNARTPANRRVLLVARLRAGETPRSIAGAVSIAGAGGVSRATVRKWLRRHESEGVVGLEDRTSRPHRLRTRVTSAQIMPVEALRRNRQPFWKIARSGKSPARPGCLYGVRLCGNQFRDADQVGGDEVQQKILRRYEQPRDASPCASCHAACPSQRCIRSFCGASATPHSSRALSCGHRSSFSAACRFACRFWPGHCSAPHAA